LVLRLRPQNCNQQDHDTEESGYSGDPLVADRFLRDKPGER
jgi:hypothetical protein